MENVPLGAYSTMRLGGSAAHLCEVSDKFEVAEAVAWAEERNLPILMIGEGTNIIWKDEGFSGLVVVNKILRYEEKPGMNDDTFITVGAGENWDSVVERTVSSGYSGLAELSLIPGTTGATPVQNVGAYGREAKDVISTVEVYDKQNKQLMTLHGDECAFGYRTSRFKTTDKNRFFITAVTFHLDKQPPKQPFYASLQAYFTEQNITEFTPQTIRDAVIAIRSAKLPDPKKVANNGSFFHNPIISSEQLAQLLGSYPDLVHWPQEDGSAKLSAAWLLEQAGFKEVHDAETGMATWPTQTLVFVNERAPSTAHLLAFKQKVMDAVQQKFGITLTQEPELLP